MTRVRWGELTRADLADRPDAVVLLPTGSTEQHGPHLPVDTDTANAAAVAEAAAERAGDALVLPALPFGYAPTTAALRARCRSPRGRTSASSATCWRASTTPDSAASSP